MPVPLHKDVCCEFDMVMDFKLLNYWVSDLNYDVRHDRADDKPRLYLSLKAHDCDDDMRSYVMLLSDDKNKILEFFGFDTTIEYDKLSEKDLFVFLDNSSKLDPAFIRFDGFKDGKGGVAGKFNKFLYAKYGGGNRKTKTVNWVPRSLGLGEAIAFFGKQDEYDEYKKVVRPLLNALYAKKELIKVKLSPSDCTFDKFAKFVCLHGALRIVDMEYQELMESWTRFCGMNWSGLRAFGI